MMEKHLDALKALSDETRMKIISLLLDYDYCVGAIARRIGLSEAAVSQHLQVLRLAGLVSGEKRGYFTHYSVNTVKLKEIAGDLSAMSERVKKNTGGCGRKKAEREKARCSCRGEKDG